MSQSKDPAREIRLNSSRAVTRSQPIDPRKLELARSQRKTPTASERLAWDIVRDRRLLGLKFRREQIIAGFVVDLYCAGLSLGIEIDGSIHDDPDRAETDAIRTEILQSRGIRVLRIAAHRVSRTDLELLVLAHMNSSRVGRPR